MRPYDLLLKAMFLLPPERIHGILSTVFSGVSRSRIVSDGLSRILPHRDPVLSQEVFGVQFPAPLGLAAGFDKNATANLATQPRASSVYPRTKQFSTAWGSIIQVLSPLPAT